MIIFFFEMIILLKLVLTIILLKLVSKPTLTWELPPLLSNQKYVFSKIKRDCMINMFIKIGSSDKYFLYRRRGNFINNSDINDHTITDLDGIRIFSLKY